MSETVQAVSADTQLIVEIMSAANAVIEERIAGAKQIGFPEEFVGMGSFISGGNAFPKDIKNLVSYIEGDYNKFSNAVTKKISRKSLSFAFDWEDSCNGRTYWAKIAKEGIKNKKQAIEISRKLRKIYFDLTGEYIPSTLST